jgi:hypothetical protein
MPIRLRFAVLVVSAFGSLFTLSTARAVEDGDVERILAAAAEDSRVMEHLDYLSNRIGPRLTSSDALTTACEWSRDRFKAFGLENATIEKWGEFPIGFNRGPWFGRVVEPTDKARPIDFGTNSWTAGTKGNVRGTALIAPENDEELSSIKDRLPGSFILTTSAGAGDFRTKRDAAYKEAGIAGVIRRVNSDLIITSGSQNLSWDNLPTTPIINVVRKDFESLVELARGETPLVLEFDIRNYFKPGPIPLYNVIADIPGAEKPDEYVIVGGHIDSWDGATGTTDNGTGCATALEAARLLMKAGVKPKRSIRFMLWSGEEQGLLGSQAYVKAHPELLPKISAVLVHDGGTNYLSGIGYTEAMKSDFEQVFAPLVGLNKEMPFALSQVRGLSGGGSDHASFLSAGVPGFFWRQAGRARYQHTHHTQFDTYDAAIPEYQKHSAVVIAIGTLGIANLDNLLSRENMVAPRNAPQAAGGPAGGNRRMLGVALGDELTIEEVLPDGVAAKAGIKAGDRLIKIDGKNVSEPDDLRGALAEGGTKKTITIQREGKQIEISVEWPAQ